MRSVSHTVQLIVRLADLRQLLEQGLAHMVRHGDAERVLVTRAGGVLAALAFGQHRYGTSVIDGRSNVQPPPMNSSAEGHPRSRRTTERNEVPLDGIGKISPLGRIDGEELLQSWIGDVLGSLAITVLTVATRIDDVTKSRQGGIAVFGTERFPECGGSHFVHLLPGLCACPVPVLLEPARRWMADILLSDQ
jgi:hypothetical protein